MKKVNITRFTKFLLSGMLLIAAFIGNAQEKFGGLALYTVRDAMGSDAKTTLQAVADAGYEYIEAAGYKDGKFYDLPPKEFN